MKFKTFWSHLEELETKLNDVTLDYDIVRWQLVMSVEKDIVLVVFEYV